MGKIGVLQSEVADQIAAGEVVERPASIVKELIENAIDARSTAVTVEIQDGGLALIRVTDNGEGMDREDASLAFYRHATSKIRSAEDLTRIVTMGFRGEALCSIAAVSRVEMTTRLRDAASGTRVRIEAGAILALDEIGCPEGTTFVVRDLFYNVPARAKFMKRASVEAGYVGDVVAQAILAHPDISFRLMHQGKNVYHSPGNGSIEDAVFAVYGREVVGHMRSVAYEDAQLSIQGVVGDVELARPHRRRQHVIINGRPVHCFVIASAVEEAYSTRLMVHKFPFFVLQFQLPADRVDVNVHPNKLEVRLRDEMPLRSAITDAIAAVLSQGGNSAMVRALTEDAPAPTPGGAPEDKPRAPQAAIKSTVTRTPRIDSSALGRPAVAPDSARLPAKPLHVAQAAVNPDLQKKDAPLITKRVLKDAAPAAQPLAVSDAAPSAQAQLPPEVLPPVQQQMNQTPKALQYRVVGQLFATYLVVEADSAMLLIDQHAAHERLLFDKYCQQLADRSVATQPMLVPYVMQLSAPEFVVVSENQALFCEMGFVMEEFGPLTFQVRAVPMLLGEPQLKNFFMEAVASLANARATNTYTLKRAAIARAACRSAIKGGDTLAGAELEALLEQMIAAKDAPLTCPHGRPVYIRMTRYELEKRFKRVT
nr:DNA mismatch repair endonuclease MutL [Maliibacterium massiliense]